ncbi:MAG TPA: BatA domain-containing protein [Silvibacterium sp.]|nr:BatA domain-containing protein [Silvibacterium sp.]
MGFLAPWFLAGSIALAVPLYLHLLRRHTSRPRPFSSLKFFEAHTQSSIKHRRLRYLILLALRLALLALLVLAFANPFVQRPPRAVAGGKLVLLVIDNSFSMRAGSRLADAKRDAEMVLASRGAEQRVQVMTFGSQLQVRTEPIRDVGALRTAIARIEPGDGRGSFGDLAHTIRSFAATTLLPVELHLFSDLQKSNMPTNFADAVMPANVSLVLHPVVKRAVPNWTVESVGAPARVWTPKTARVQAVISGYNTPEAVRTVWLVVNNKIITSRRVNVPAGGRATIEFDSLDVPYGASRCEVRIDSADAFPQDDASFFAVQRSDPQIVLFLHRPDDTRSPVYFKAALGAAAESAFATQNVPVDQADNVQLSKYAFVVLSDVSSLPRSLEDNLSNYVRGGGSVLVASGTETGRRTRIPLLGAGSVEAHFYSNTADRYRAVGDIDPAYPPLAHGGRWPGVKFYFAVAVNDPAAHVGGRLTDGTPILLDKEIGEGRVLLFTSGLDNLTNDLPLHAEFVPFVQDTAFYLSGTAREPDSRLVDSILELRRAKERSVAVEVVDPEGRRPLSLLDAANAQSFKVTHAGFYQLRLANGRQQLIGVNPDRVESDLSVLSGETQALWAGSRNAQPPTAAAERAGEKNQPYGLWWYVMLLVLAVAIAESWVASRYLGIRREDS